MYNYIVRASQSCLVSNAGVGGAGEKTKQQLTQRFNGARSPVQPLKDLGKVYHYNFMKGSILLN